MPRRSAVASATAASTLSSAARTIALPTTTPSASAATARACSGREIPKPIHSGSVVAARTRAAVAGRSDGSSLRSPVTPRRLTR